MKYKCLIFDHDDTTVNSTATIHYPCFVEFLKLYRPGETLTVDDYFRYNFAPGFIEMCTEKYSMSDKELEVEVNFWQNYVVGKIPAAYPGIKEVMEKQKAAGGRIAVISHSMEGNIRRDFMHNGLPEPDLVFGWDRPLEQRKPYAWPLEQVLKQLDIRPEEALMIDDLKPGFDMAAKCGVDFAAAGWAYDVPEIEDFMKRFSKHYFKTVAELDAFLNE